MIGEYYKMALASIRGARFRSFLTMFGIIIGVSSVVTIVSLGEGVRQQVSEQVDAVSDSLVVVRPGKQAHAKAFSLDALRTSMSSSGSLSEKDWRDSEKVEGVSSAVPIGIVSGIATYDNTEYVDGTIIATTERLPVLLNQKVEFGEFFDAQAYGRNVAVIGSTVAEQLFKENVPVGKSVVIRGKPFIVQGVFEQQKSGTFAAMNINNAIMLPFDSARDLGGTIQIMQLYIESSEPDSVGAVAQLVNDTLKANHAGQEDFTILQKEEALEATNSVFYQLTLFIAGVAFISFIVGGIGIMNIMFATVSERTREIGIRKAIGATNSQILGQFVMESIVLSVVGGTIGVVLAYLANALFRVTTDLQPVTTVRVVVMVAGISVVTGVISGLLPALKAAHKDPIASLRADV
ncbi:MAG TPA: ABC transporter permease [Candidatus Saccharibacteria bacterium]|nr:ABC transporter permease [Candidatus Saccharibacteria bacterium]